MDDEHEPPPSPPEGSLQEAVIVSGDDLGEGHGEVGDELVDASG